MSLRVVLYAEGALESGPAGFPLPLGDELGDEDLGPAQARLTIAATADLGAIAGRCPAFQDFRSKLS